MENIIVRPYDCERDAEILAAFEGFRRGTFSGPGVTTAVAEKNGRVIASVTSTLMVYLGNFLKSPEASAVEVTAALALLSRALEFHAAQNGAVEAAAIVSDALKPFQRLIERGGYRKVDLMEHSLFGLDLLKREGSSTL